MEKINLRSICSETRMIIKKQVISLLDKKIKHQEIAEIVGISKPAVDKIACAYKKEGTACLNEKPRGRKLGENRKLTPEQEEEIYNIIINMPPNQVGLDSMLWTRADICQLIMEKYNINIKLRTMSDYLKRWDMTYQRPAKKAYLQDDIKLDIFMNKSYPDIVQKARKEDAIILWGDETGINNQSYYAKGFAPKGNTPIVPSFSKIEKINMISAIGNYGICRFLCYDENMTQQLFIDFMERLIIDTDRKVLLIVDNLKVHHGKIVAEWLSKHKDEIELFFTPPYSPEINPDEYLNHNLKQNIHSGIIPHTKKQIREKVEKYMNNIQKSGEKVSCLFEHKNLKYIQYYGC